MYSQLTAGSRLINTKRRGEIERKGGEGGGVGNVVQCTNNSW